MSISSEITRINNEVTNQANLISQIATALEGKAGGGGSGGGSMETCTVTVNASGATVWGYGATIYENDSVSAVGSYNARAPISTITINNVIKNSNFFIAASAIEIGFSSNDATLVVGSSMFLLVKIGSAANITINVLELD